MTSEPHDGSDLRARIGLVAGPAALLVLLVSPAPGGMGQAAWRTAAVGVLMAIWWVTEAIPIPATALVPLVAFPLLDVATIGKTAAPYANPVIFLFMGGFMIAAGMQASGLHRRIALAIIRLVGTSERGLIGGFMVATAFLSLWVSNTATVAMMLPMAVSVIALGETDGDETRRGFPTALLLGVAYAASIGGIGTLIGTPPNALLAGFAAETFGETIGFAQWLAFGLPLVVVSLPLCWLLLTRAIFRLGDREIAGGREMIRREIEALGSMSRHEWVVATIASLAATTWILRPWLERYAAGLSDAGIAIAGAIALFVVPVSTRPLRPALGWSDAEKIPWSVLVLFGGGLSLAAAIASTGLADEIGRVLGALHHFSPIVVSVGATTIVIFLTELTSNTATAAAFLPIVASLAEGMGVDPLVLAIPATIAASCAFMLPVATPPNAIVYGSGRITVPEMARAGIWLNLTMIVVINVMVWTVGIRVFGL